jgi:hypothetical protein
LLDDARRQEEVARQGIGELRQGVERAAESVLGDETDALRRAREQLDRLARELNDEIAQNVPADSRAEGAEQRRQSASADGQSQTSDETTTSAQAAKARQGEGQPGEQRSGEQSSGEQESGARRGGRGAPRSLSDSAGRNDLERGGSVESGRLEQGGFEPHGGSNGNRPWAPIAGEDFLDWSDRLRDVEEMVDDPKLQAEAARIRDRARRFRVDVKRHSLPPNWDLVREQVLGPLAELRDRVAEELLRLTARDALVPLDRDPVPPKYSEKTRLYYERLGIGR